MRILILGAGATGGYFGGLLATAGVDVTFLVRPPRREALKSRGLTIASPLGDVTTPVRAITRDDISSAFDAIILSNKAFGLADAIEAIGPAVGSHTLILPLLNGMRHLDDLDAAFGQTRVLGGTCHLSVAQDEEGVIRHLSPYASLTHGPRTADQNARSALLQKELQRGAFEARYSADIVAAMWEKWVFLATLAGATCLMRASVGEIARAAGGERFTLAMLDECCAVATACGYPPQPAAQANAKSVLTDPQSAIAASMLRDIQSGRPVEGDHIVGDLIRRGREHAVPTPLLELAYVQLQAYQGRLRAAAATAG